MHQKLTAVYWLPVPIPAHIVELTGISEEHVRNAKSFAECADQILDFIGDSILVAHNADFDYNFLNSELVRIGRKPLDNPVIDTLDLARSMQDRKGICLGQIARSYGIRYDEDVAHRADYDAEVLANTYMNMLNNLKHIQNPLLCRICKMPAALRRSERNMLLFW